MMAGWTSGRTDRRVDVQRGREGGREQVVTVGTGLILPSRSFLLRTAFLLLLLISATWLLGLLAVNRDALSFHYLFAIFSGLQGPFVLLFHCVLNQEVRKHLKGVLGGRKLHLEDSTTTRATLLTRSLNCNTTFGDGPDMLRTDLGESTASLDSTVRSGCSSRFGE
ncbi:PREDICTED: cadherin EGF LAG seven-pass G-type receptor 1-like, partial [Rhinopithecus bieti]|uniref:cadherin EGF LAG seven-pass G-type receptor 1-like n=1 Tax=Rhinopithecus bieti TaxID=61621 RepID=UPI00083C10B3